MITRRIGMVLCLAFPLLAMGQDDVGQHDVARWRADLDSYETQLHEKHINPHARISHQALMAELDALKRRLPSLNRSQIDVEMMRITRLIGDGHTQYAFWKSEHHMFPFAFLDIEGEFRVVRTSPEHRHLLGQRLMAINGLSSRELRKRLSPVAQGVENAQSLRVSLAGQMPVAEILHGLGITADLKHAQFTFVDDHGKATTVPVSAGAMHDRAQAVTASIVQPATPFDTKVIEASDHLWLSADPQRRVAYVNVSGYVAFEDMMRFSHEVRTYLEQRDIRYLVIDLRENGGGDFFLGLVLASELVLVDNLVWEGGVYALIGAKTYSAGMSNAAQFRQILNARLVGEPTGANPVGYQDQDSFRLPHSGATIHYSKRRYRFQDTPSEGVLPDVPINTTWQHYATGQDMPLRWILSDIAKQQGRDDSNAHVPDSDPDPASLRPGHGTSPPRAQVLQSAQRQPASRAPRSCTASNASPASAASIAACTAGVIVDDAWRHSPSFAMSMRSSADSRHASLLRQASPLSAVSSR